MRTSNLKRSIHAYATLNVRKEAKILESIVVCCDVRFHPLKSSMRLLVLLAQGTSSAAIQGIETGNHDVIVQCVYFPFILHL